MSKYITSFEIELPDFGVVTVAVTYFEPTIPGRFTGKPENCYPDEGGFGEYVFIDNGVEVDLDEYVTPEVEADIQKIICSYLDNKDEDYDE